MKRTVNMDTCLNSMSDQQGVCRRLTKI